MTHLTWEQGKILDRLPEDARVIRWDPEHHGPELQGRRGTRVTVLPSGQGVTRP